MTFRIEKNGPKCIDTRQCEITFDCNPSSMNWSEYYLVESIGKGIQGEVVKLKHNVSNHFIAAKISPNDNSLREMEILRKLDHENIVKFLGCECTPKTKIYYLEYLEGEELYQQISKKQDWSIKEFFPIYIQIFKALEYLQSKNIGHMDIKADNIIVLKSGIVKILDFGNSVDHSKFKSVRGPIGSYVYGAPEMNLDISFHGFPFDVFSLHVLLAAAMLGKYCWSKAHKTDPKYLQWTNINHPTMHFKKLDDDLFRFLKRVLTHDPINRPTLSQIRQDEWFIRMVSEN